MLADLVYSMSVTTVSAIVTLGDFSVFVHNYFPSLLGVISIEIIHTLRKYKINLQITHLLAHYSFSSMTYPVTICWIATLTGLKACSCLCHFVLKYA